MKLTAMGGGSTYVFHKAGYLLFNYHLLEDILKTHDIEDSVVVFHDSQKGVGYEVSILSYSKNYDVVLGKIDAPEGMYISTPIMKEEPVYPDFVYTCVLGNSNAIITKIDELLDKTFEEEDSGISESLKISINDLSIDGFIGRVVNQFRILDEDTDKYKPGMRAYVPEQSAPFSLRRRTMDFLTFGSSGTPVFNAHNQLTGVVAEILIPPPRSIEPKGVVFAGPLVIREMLSNYVKECLSE